MATKYEGLTSAQWANRIAEYNPGKFDKSALVKHYTAQQLGKFQLLPRRSLMMTCTRMTRI